MEERPKQAGLLDGRLPKCGGVLPSKAANLNEFVDDFVLSDFLPSHS